MTTHVALLRAVNVAGKNLVPMTVLKALAVELKLVNPRTLLQSGNLIFEDHDEAAATVEARLETAIAARLGVITNVIVRSAAQWQAAIAGNPLAAAASNPNHLLLICCKQPVPPANVIALMAAIKGRETVRGAGRELYIAYPDGIGRSKLTAAIIDKHTGSPGTGRNWNTVLKINALLRAPE